MSNEAVGELIVGVVFLLCGLLTSRHGGRGRPVGLLLSATGLLWMAGFLGDPALFLYRAPLVFLILSYPTGRLSGRIVPAVAIAACGLALWAAPNRGATVATALPLLVLVTSAYVLVTARGPVRRARATAFAAATMTMGMLAAGTALRAVDPSLESAVAWGFDVAMVLAALLLAADVRWGRWSQASLAGLVLDLGQLSGPQPVADRLARALGDPGLSLFYWLSERGVYVDEQGRPVLLPAPSPGRSVMLLEHHGRRVAAMVHDPAIADDPALVGFAATVAWVALDNVRMQAQIQARVTELEASRRRIVDAVDAERRRLDEQLEVGAQRHLARLADLLADGALDDPVVAEQLTAARAALHEFALGMYPRTLIEQGLGQALGELCRAYPTPVELTVSVAELPDRSGRGRLLHSCGGALECGQVRGISQGARSCWHP